jgi:hypothetical protein
MLKKLRVPLIILAVVIVVAGVGLASFTRVRTGSRLLCKYNHVIKENISKATVLRWTAKDYGIRESTSVCAKHKRLERLRAEALEKLKKGDVAGAKKLFKEIQAVDPVFLDVNTQLDRIAEGENAGTPGTPGTPGGPGSDVDLATLLPGSLNGFKASEIEKGEGYASRDYRPDTQERMQGLLATVHNAGSLSGAEQFIARVDKTGFSRNARITTVNGYAAYFGTDGTTYATLAWAAGPIVYELQGHATSGNPAELEPDLMDIAAAFR